MTILSSDVRVDTDTCLLLEKVKERQPGVTLAKSLSSVPRGQGTDSHGTGHLDMSRNSDGSL